MKAITKDNFKTEVQDAEKVVLLDAWAAWCGPCRAMEPLLDQLEGEVKDWAEIVKLNVDEQMELAQQLGISAMPTFMVFKGGQMVGSTVGMTSKENLLSLLTQAK